MVDLFKGRVKNSVEVEEEQFVHVGKHIRRSLRIQILTATQLSAKRCDGLATKDHDGAGQARSTVMFAVSLRIS